jgi:hypothetical protein
MWFRHLTEASRTTNIWSRIYQCSARVNATATSKILPWLKYDHFLVHLLDRLRSSHSVFAVLQGRNSWEMDADFWIFGNNSSHLKRHIASLISSFYVGLKANFWACALVSWEIFCLWCYKRIWRLPSTRYTRPFSISMSPVVFLHLRGAVLAACAVKVL